MDPNDFDAGWEQGYIAGHDSEKDYYCGLFAKMLKLAERGSYTLLTDLLQHEWSVLQEYSND